MRLGADPDQLDRLAAALAAAADRLGGLERRLTAVRSRAAGATVAHRAAYLLMVEVEPLLRRLAVRLADRAADLRRRADRQRRASAPMTRPLRGMTTVHESAEGDGRWVGRAGPAGAATVAVLVPGVGTHHGHRRRLGREALRLWRHLEARHADHGVAVVAWIGYDTPDHLMAGVDRRPAVEGAVRLAADLDALRRDGARRVVLVGHSYGAVVAARAVAAGAAVDELVLLGAPGLGVDDPADLELRDGGSLWSAVTDEDRIAWVARSGLLHGPDPARTARRLPTSERGHARYLSDPVLLEALGEVVVGARR